MTNKKNHRNVISRSKKKLIIKAAQGHCYWCESQITSDNLQIDHKIPLAQNGSDSVNNLVAACFSCNMAKSANSWWKATSKDGKTITVRHAENVPACDWKIYTPEGCVPELPSADQYTRIETTNQSYKDKCFEDQLKHYVDFVKRNNRHPERYGKAKGEVKAHNWARWQIKYQRQNRLSGFRKALIEDKISGWKWETPSVREKQDAYWEVRLADFLAWVNSAGRQPKTNSSNKEERSLASWAKRTRARYRGTVKPSLHQWQVEAMNEIAEWEWEPKGNGKQKAVKGSSQYKSTISSLEKAIKLHGPVLAGEAASLEAKAKASRWASKQRFRRHSRSPEMIAMIEAIPGWTWNPNEDNSKADEEWRLRLIELAEFIKQNKRTPSAVSESDDEASLGSWRLRQRRDLKKGNLENWKVCLAEETLPSFGNGSALAKENLFRQWDERRLRSVALFETNGRWPSTYSKNPQEASLGSWSTFQRSDLYGGNFVKGTERHRRFQALDSTPGWNWDPKDYRKNSLDTTSEIS